MALLALYDSGSERYHVLIDESFQTQVRLLVSILRTGYLDERLQEVLKVHIRLVTIDGAEDQVQPLFHLFVVCRCSVALGCIVALRLLVDARVTHNFVILLRLDRVHVHPVVHQCVMVEEGLEHLPCVEHLSRGVLLLSLSVLFLGSVRGGV